MNVDVVELGKYFEVKIYVDDWLVVVEIDEMCDCLLVNVNMEIYCYEIIEMEVL